MITDSVKVFYSTAPIGAYLLDTLELRHPDLIDKDGNEVEVIRIVADSEPLTAQLEATAPLNPNSYVDFEPHSFRASMPPVDEQSSPEASFIIDNVDNWMIRNIERVVSSTEPLRVIYRQYVSTDLTGPVDDFPMDLIMGDVKADLFQVSGRGTFADLSNKVFPIETYTPSRFPALVQL